MALLINYEVASLLGGADFGNGVRVIPEDLGLDVPTVLEDPHADKP